MHNKNFIDPMLWMLNLKNCDQFIQTHFFLSKKKVTKHNPLGVKVT